MKELKNGLKKKQTFKKKLTKIKYFEIKKVRKTPKKTKGSKLSQIENRNKYRSIELFHSIF